MASIQGKRQSEREAAEVYQIKVTLLETNPAIWRQLLVPAAISLRELHEVLQVAMGWENVHEHVFEVAGRRYGEPAADWPLDLRDERRVRLADVAGIGSTVLYQYDFGDNWMHELVVERVLPGTLVRAECIGGKQTCPPEDVGGTDGFATFRRRVMPQHPAYKEYRRWLGREFWPDRFDYLEVTRALDAIPLSH